MNLYTTHAKKFSNSRAYPWKGWGRLTEYIDNKPLSILDIGCGNGRFLDFLEEKHIDVKSYTGIDNSKELLEIAIDNTKNTNASKKFIEIDLNDSEWSRKLNDEYDLIVCFGVMHHLENNKARENVYNSVNILLHSMGIFINTFWQFAAIEGYVESHKLEESNIAYNEVSLGENDYLLTFGKDNSTYRFCHFSNEDEIRLIESESNLLLVDSFFSDGKEDRMNLYKIYKKDVI
ncbi:MAG: class I SAM-dependent methyltransferase [Candidatus Dojkabacteria bacterium]|nr:class I SAM-dependent methyltransferase [Candidatus Dojkabacteria bacterium]MDQ7021734.1 class I SAM-dependent methyltransferase [Candidatus Dojkabacteria bacterium]